MFSGFKVLFFLQVGSILLQDSCCLPGRKTEDSYHGNGRVRRATPSEVKSSARPLTIPYADWNQVAREELNAAKASKPRETIAKNVVLVIGDGMGLSTQTAARYLKAQQQQLDPHKAKLSWESMPYTGLSKTYNTDIYTGDSAATATAFLCGVKGRQGTVGVNDQVERRKCDKYQGNDVTSMIERAVEKEKWGGIITTTRVTHATPAGAYASVADRDWESSVIDECKDVVEDVATQLITGEQSKQFRVILGGGRKHFLPNTTPDQEYPQQNGSRKDGIDLIAKWRQLKLDDGVSSSRIKYVSRQSEFDAIDTENTDYLLGLYEPDHTNYEVDRNNDVWGEPSLSENVEKALKILQRSEKGYFLLIEGGRIDHAHHENLLKRSLEETLELERAVDKVMTMTDADDTLLIVTADHSHVFTLGADQHIANDIFGYTIDQFGVLRMNEDDKPMFMMGYADGPGWQYHRSQTSDFKNEMFRKNISEDIESGFTGNKDFQFDGPAPRDSESHGAEDVAIYARGPMAHLLTGIHEQNYIAHLAMYAACVGPYQSEEHCACVEDPQSCASNSLLMNIYVIVLMLVIRILH